MKVLRTLRARKSAWGTPKARKPYKTIGNSSIYARSAPQKSVPPEKLRNLIKPCEMKVSEHAALSKRSQASKSCPNASNPYEPVWK